MKKALAFSAAALALAIACGGSGEREVNEKILRSLPEFPGSELISVDSQPYYNCNLILPRTLGYTTTAKYRVPKDVTADDVVGFYIKQLGTDWEFRKEAIGVREPVAAGGTPRPSPIDIPSIPMVGFVRGTATVGISTADMVFPTDPVLDFTVSVNSEGTTQRPNCD